MRIRSGFLGCVKIGALRRDLSHAVSLQGNAVSKSPSNADSIDGRPFGTDKHMVVLRGN
jgi:hypothetical protein